MKPEPHPQADEAARYVLGQLAPEARHVFEVQLTQSAELRALVQELEEGVEALAQSVPQRRPPPQTWARIEQAVNQDVQRKVITLPTWLNGWRSGWAAAAVCLFAWFSYAWWTQRSEKARLANAPAPVERAATNPSVAVTPIDPSPVRPEVGVTNNAIVRATSQPPRPATNPELTSLRSQVALLQSQLDQLSELMRLNRAIMDEPGRFKFFSVTDPTTAGTENPESVPLSPGLQRAIFYAMAQDLGWISRQNQRGGPNNRAPAAAMTTAWGIDFVDLAAKSQSASPATTPTEAAATPVASAVVSVQSSGNIPGYLQKESGKDLVLAFDSSIVVGGNTVEFWNGHQFVGSAVTGENPMVVTVPLDRIGENLTVTSSPGSGPSNIIGNFFLIRNPPPPTTTGNPPP